jgi:hypothetical protein
MRQYKNNINYEFDLFSKEIYLKNPFMGESSNQELKHL